MGFWAVVCLGGRSVLSDRIVYCWHCTVHDALILLHSDVSEFGMGGKKWCTREALKICPARTSSDHAEAMLH